MASLSCQILSFIYPSFFLLLFFFWINNHKHSFHFTPPKVLPNHNQHISSIYRIEESLARARDAIYKAARTRSFESSEDKRFIPRGSIYRNPRSFYQSYTEMEKRFKIWVYKEGEPPLFHHSSANNIYSMEGQFIDELEKGNNSFLARNPDEAVTFFLPIGVTMVIRYLNKHYDHHPLITVLKDYIGVLSNKYSYWNRSNGVDHFFVGCHDWAPDVSADHSKLFKNLIRVICNANTTEGFRPAKDVALPEINIPFSELGPPILGQHPNNRSILAFFAGGAHGYVRDRLFQCWKDKDIDIQVHQYLPNNLNYSELMGQTKFCLCVSGYEVASPRIVESIYAGCVPVLISDAFIPPFSDVLDWTQFSLHIPVAKIPKIKSILQGVPMEDYLRKQKMVMQVQRHFILHRPSQPFDLFHMVLHSIWFRRLNVRLQT